MPAVKEPVLRQPLQEKVYNCIKEAIVNCEMLPGVVISEDALIKKFGTSRTPIREALLRLQRERLVVIFPRQGTFVSEISSRDISEIYELRLIIEPQIAGISCSKLNSEVLKEFHDLFVRLDGNEDFSYLDWFRHDRDFHNYIVDSSGNDYLQQIYATIMNQDLRMRIIAGKMPLRIGETNREHIMLLDALLEKDAAKAERLMRAHIIASRDTALRAVNFRESEAVFNVL